MHRYAFVLSCLFGWPCLLAQQSAVAESKPPQQVRLRGRVVTADGDAVVGAGLRFARAASLVTADVLQQPTAVTDAEGRYQLDVEAPRAPEPGRSDGADALGMPPPLLLVAAKGFASIGVQVPLRGQREGVRLPKYLLGTVGEADAAYADVTDLEDVVLTPGHRLVSRVRDAAGKPLAGVRVVARDLLAEGNHFGAGTGVTTFFCAAVSDAAGIVNMPCVLPIAASLTFVADGYYKQRLAPVSASTPVEVTMQKSGWVQGRVLDKEGHSIDGARVKVGYERQSGMEPLPVRTAADGSFRTSLEQPGRWRVLVSLLRDGQTVQAHSAVFSGPRENLEILIEPPTQRDEVRLPVRVVAKGTGQPIDGFRVAAAWQDYANQNPGYREYLLCTGLAQNQPGSKGDGSVRTPGEQEAKAGWLRVVAPGFAPASQQVEWTEPTAGESPAAIAVELEPEAVVRGVLRDETSGKPVLGALVIARMHQDASHGVFGEERQIALAAATSGADGAFELRGLGAGKWDLRAYAEQRPRCPLIEVELATSEQRAGVDMTLPSGATVVGKLVGSPPKPMMRAFLARVPLQAFAGVAMHYSGQGSDDQHQHLAPIGSDQTFRCEGVGLDNWQLVLRVPQAPRRGGDLYLPIEPFRVRPSGVQRDFDCSLDRPGVIRGKVTFTAADVPLDQLVVVARSIGDEGQGFLSPHDMQLVGARSFVGPSAEYELHVGPGNYRLVVVDLGTMLPLLDAPQKVLVKSGGAANLDLCLELVRVELALKGPTDGQPMADVERVEVHVISKASKLQGVKVDTNVDYDRGVGIRWPLGQTSFSVVLPPGDATFACRNTVHAIRVDDNRWSNAPLGRAELEITLGNHDTRCIIEVGPPPEVIEPQPKPGNAGATVEPADMIK